MSAPTNAGGPAFPSVGEGFGNPSYSASGMTLRDYLAAQALAGMVSRAPVGAEFSFSDYAVQAYFFADAMLVERELKP